MSFIGAGMAACVGDSSSPFDASTDTTPSDSTITDSPADGPTGPINGVVMALDGTPLPLKVDVGGQVVTADATGHFTAPDPGPAYSIRFHYTDFASPVQIYTIYRNLTRRDPTLMMPLHYGFSSALVSGNVPGAPPTDPPALVGRMVFAPKSIVGVNSMFAASVTGDAGAYGPSQIFFPNTVQSGTLYFFEKSLDDAGNTAGYSALAQSPNVGFAADAGLAHSFTGSSSVSSGPVSGSVTLPTTGTWALDQTTLLAVFGGTTPVPIDSSTSGTTFNFLGPNINGIKLTVGAHATASTGATSAAWKTGLAANTSGIGLTLPHPPAVTSPAPNATVPLSSALFAYTNVQGLGYLTFTCADPGSDGGIGSWNYVVHIIAEGNTTTTNAPTDPQLSLLLPPSGSLCTFVAAAMPNFTTPDSAAGPTGITSSFGGVFAASDGSFAESDPLPFIAQ